MMKRWQAGQALILFVFSIVALFAMAGLGIDGGRLFVARRRAQSAADAAAMAGALVIAQQRDGVVSAADLQAAKEAAVRRAADNGFTITTDQVEITEEGEEGGVYYVSATIPVEIPPTFIGVVYRSPLRAQAAAQVRVRPFNPFAGFAIATLSKDVCPGLVASGNAEVDVEGGVYVNAACPSALSVGGSLTFQAAASPGIQVVGGVKTSGHPHVVPSPVSGVSPILTPEWPEPACDYTISGRNFPHHLSPGVYCISGNVQLNGGSYEGSGVTLYLGNGSFAIRGNAQVNFTAPTSGPWKGLLIYMAPTNNHALTINGGASSVLKGTIYAPGPPPGGNQKCTVEGSSESFVFEGQLACYSVKLIGSSKWSIVYNPDWVYSPPVLEMWK